MTRRRILIVVAGLLAVLGLEQLGQGAWIHLKARLAQHLLQRAWARTARGETRARRSSPGTATHISAFWSI